jgi:hypothetical protein
MISQVHFVWILGCLLLATAGLVWIMLCGVTAQWGEKEGLGFWKTFTLSFLLSPLAGLLVVVAFRSPRTGRSLAETASRG